ACARPARLQAAAVEGRGVERRGVDVVEAAHVDRDHLVALRIGSARERAHAALRAEQVMDRFLAELVVLEVLGAGAQRKACGRHERPQRATLLADRAVAGNDVAECGRTLEAPLAAMAAAGIGLGCGHMPLPIYAETRCACPDARDRRARPRTAGSNSSTCRRTRSAPRSVSR